jgi:hypothetical protein
MSNSLYMIAHPTQIELHNNHHQLRRTLVRVEFYRMHGLGALLKGVSVSIHIQGMVGLGLDGHLMYHRYYTVLLR